MKAVLLCLQGLLTFTHSLLKTAATLKDVVQFKR